MNQFSEQSSKLEMGKPIVATGSAKGKSLYEAMVKEQLKQDLVQYKYDFELAKQKYENAKQNLAKALSPFKIGDKVKWEYSNMHDDYVKAGKISKISLTDSGDVFYEVLEFIPSLGRDQKWIVYKEGNPRKIG